MTLQRGRPDDLEVDLTRYNRLRESAEGLLRDIDISVLSPVELDRLDKQVRDWKTVYVFDVRTIEKFVEGHLPEALSVAGGQIVQTADRHVTVRDAEIGLVSETHVRAAITGYWLDEMGFPNVNVLRGETTAWTKSGRRLVADDAPEEPLGAAVVEETVEYVSPTELVDVTYEKGW